MKKIFMAVFSALLCLCVTGCSSAGTISTYTMVLERMPANLDPQVAQRPEELLAITNTFDGLFEYRNGEITKNVCEDYTVSSDGLSYTFILREDSFFYVNKNEQIPVTAHDFVFSFERILNPNTLSPYYDDFANIEQVTAEKPNVLLIKLKKADSNFLAKLCMPCAVPCNREFFESTKGAYGLTVKNILSNGPFTINYLADDGSYATLIRVKDYDNGIDRIRISLSDGKSEQTALYADDKISGYFSDSSGDGTGTLCDAATFSMYFNPLNSTLSNRNIRNALAYYCYAMENSGANLDAVTQSYSLFSNALTFGEEKLNSMLSLTKPDYMLAGKPKNMLVEGYKELGISSLDKLTVLVPSDLRYSVIVENINQLWQKNLGVFVALEFIPASEVEARMEKGNFDIAFLSTSPLKNDPVDILRPFSIIDEHISQHIDALGGSSLSDRERLENLSCAHSDIVNSAYAVPMCRDTSYYVHKSYFSGIEINPFGNLINLKYAKVK